MLETIPRAAKDGITVRGKDHGYPYWTIETRMSYNSGKKNKTIKLSDILKRHPVPIHPEIKIKPYRQPPARDARNDPEYKVWSKFKIQLRLTSAFEARWAVKSRSLGQVFLYDLGDQHPIHQIYYTSCLDQIQNIAIRASKQFISNGDGTTFDNWTIGHEEGLIIRANANKLIKLEQFKFRNQSLESRSRFQAQLQFEDAMKQKGDNFLTTCAVDDDSTVLDWIMFYLIISSKGDVWTPRK